MATTNSDTVHSVDFSIDGKTRWTEVNPPYFFNDDRQLLATWLLGNGRHVLTADVETAAGTSRRLAVHVVVTGAQQTPSAMTGSFQRKLEGPVPGVWRIYIHRNGLIRFDDPEGSGGNEAVTVRGSNIKFWGPADWLEPPDRQGGFCDPESPGSLTWQTATNGIAFSGRSGCSDRDGLFVGTWTRTS